MKTHLLLIVAILIVSCTQKTEKEYYSHEVSEKISKELIQQFSHEDYPLPPPPISHSGIYMKVKSDSICKTDILNLHYVYRVLNSNSKKETLENFIYNAINQKTIFESGLYFYPNECFTLTDSITEYYNNHSFDAFLNRYCKEQSNGTYHFKGNMEKEMPTISYHLYLNDYGMSQDCVSGYYIIHKSVF
ncbi:hypothetical protein [Flavobacterium beibuense]|uniref:hypothetical protein n=1 Tax=Flavobacterium beibuense TaxID=657326 RepID=UPI003A8C8D00